MSYLPISLLAYLLNTISVLIDKFQLSKTIPNPLVYTFYISAFSLVALFLIPFSKIPSASVFAIASLSTILFTLGLYFMFRALKIGLATRVIPVISTLVPIFLLIDASVKGSLSANEIWSVYILISGLVFLTWSDFRGKLHWSELVFELIASLLYSFSYILLREAYLHQDFVTVMSWSKLILIPFGLLILILPKLRHTFLSTNHGQQIKTVVNFKSKTGFIFLTGQICGGLSGVLLTYSISLASPALVNSLQGSQHVFMFFIALVLSKRFPEIFGERSSRLIFSSKLFGIILIGLGLYILAFTGAAPKETKIGVTYSPRFSKAIGLDPKKTYVEMLDELKVKYVRLPVYWDEVETNPGQFDFSNIDFYLQEAQKRDVKIILGLGYKQPRWPECYTPQWINSIPLEHRSSRLLNLVASEIKYFRRYENIEIWQVENEPFLHFFGDCKKEHQINYDLLKDEIALVKVFDSRPILVTDSGELSVWAPAMSLSDIFGSTLYRQVYTKYIGMTTYPFPPIFYKIKDQIVRAFINQKGESIVAELQAEPWAINNRPVIAEPIETQTNLLSPKMLKDNYRYAEGTFFSRVYFWGVEWWYWMKYQGHPEYVETVKEIIQKPNQ